MKLWLYLSGSAPLPQEVRDRFESLSKCTILEGYGLTESSPVTHISPISGMRPATSTGIPFPSTDAKIMDGETGAEALPLGEVGELAPDEVVEFTTNYNFLVFVRLQSQVKAIEAGLTATDYVDPKALNVVERERLRIAFQTVKSFQEVLKIRFKLDFISS